MISSEVSGFLRGGKVTRKLAEIAFIGAFRGRTQAAETIFRSLRLLCPGNPHVDLGLAMICAIDGRPTDGLAVLERIPPSRPTQQAALSKGLESLCAGLMLQEAGHPAAAEKKLAASLVHGGEAADLARELASINRSSETRTRPSPK
jgi:hypothetical protein